MNKEILRHAAKPFGSVAALSRASGIPLRTLSSFAESEEGSSGIKLALTILASHPKMAPEICKHARAWQPTSLEEEVEAAIYGAH